MASGYRSGGIDFDDLFDPYVSGTKSIVTGRRVNGVDLRERYAPLSVGSKRADVGYRVNGVDVSNLWAAKGTASYWISGLGGKALRAVDTAVTNQEWLYASVSVSLQPNGTWTVSGGTYAGAVAQPNPTSGTWLTFGGSAADYDVRITVSATGTDGHQVSNSAPSWVSMSQARGAGLSLPQISAVNTSTRNASASVRIDIRRRSTGNIVSTTDLSMSVRTQGWV